MAYASSSVEDSSTDRDKNKAGSTRLGQISFINALPVVMPLQLKQDQLDVKLVLATPAQLNAQLQSGELELGAMSSYYFLEDGGFELFPRISISGSGKVGSVLLFSHEEDLLHLEGKVISVPESSATSIKLMQVLLKEELGVSPLLKLASDLDKEQEEPSAFLLIGDKALEFDAGNSSLYKFDLAQWWHKRYSLPFVFGVWAARKPWVAQNPKKFNQLAIAMEEACKFGLSEMLPDVIVEAEKRTSLSPERLKSYFLEDLDYRMTAQHLEALKLFQRLCKANGFLQ